MIMTLEFLPHVLQLLAIAAGPTRPAIRPCKCELRPIAHVPERTVVAAPIISPAQVTRAKDEGLRRASFNGDGGGSSIKRIEADQSDGLGRNTKECI
ncbi:hypothetical protein U9M48_023952 [Paspalum notatum var. saurae]|uniref:Secreted protein n=1 Tax=Paspalum notatum var. saurae TaxID=547442 RepID=A0AAQ3TPR8_PASNO